MTETIDRVLTTEEAAEYLNKRGIRITSRALRDWRSRGRPNGQPVPKSGKVGGRVYYDPAKLDEFVTESMATT